MIMNLDKRKKAFEHKFVLAAEQEFKAKVMATKLFGLWAGDKMKLDPLATDSYVKSLVELSIYTKEYDPVISHVEGDFLKVNVKIDKAKLEQMFLEKLEICQEKLAKSE